MRVLLIDDHTLFRSGLRELLERRLEVVDRVHDRLKALVQRGIVRRPGLSGPAQQKQSDDQWQQSLHLV